MASTHESIFSYNITRPYPLRWFTPVVLVGFVVATLIFSFLNFVSNGYNLTVETSSNPNKTISEGIWFKNWPSYFTNKVEPSCQLADLHVNTPIFTNQTALTYTLTGVWKESDTISNKTIMPSMPYFNNPIEQCVVTSIDLDIDNLDGRSANQYTIANWGASVRAYISCSIKGPSGQTKFNLTTTYNYVPESVQSSAAKAFLGTGFLSRDKKKKASLYWGESLMSMYWVYLTRALHDLQTAARVEQDPSLTKGSLTFTSNNLSIHDITDLRFFEVDYIFISDLGRGYVDIIWPLQYNSSRDITYLDSIGAKPNIWIQSDGLVKSTYSTILTDLGQVMATPNILTDDKVLQYFTMNFSSPDMQSFINAEPGPATKDYITLKAITGPLGVTPSVISTNYICQIPRLKSRDSIFVAVLVADLVFLQTLWKFFTFITNWLLFRKRPSANHCRDCTAQRTGHEFRQHGSADNESKESVGLYKQVLQEDGVLL